MLGIILVLVLSWILGVIGFCQIIGSIQNARERGAGLTAFTIILWGVILLSACFVVHRFFYGQRIAYYIGTAAGFFSSLGAGRIR